MPSQKQVYRFLRDLGDCPDRVAEKLILMSVSGKRHDEIACPLAMAIKRKFVVVGAYVARKYVCVVRRTRREL
jgi:hypothetical protein